MITTVFLINTFDYKVVQPLESRIGPVTHALTQLINLLTHLREITRILTQFYKIENNLLAIVDGYIFDH